MAHNTDLLNCKEMFLQENQLFSEIELNNESKPIEKLDDINLLDNEIWLLQCPKNMDITELQNQKLKLPGRSNIHSSEAVSMEFDGSNKRHAFAHYNKKGRYVLSLLPVRGTIVFRDRLKATETVTEEQAEEFISSAKRVPMPKSIRVRHPLLGTDYIDKAKLDKSIEERLQNADKKTAQMLKERLNQKTTRLAVRFKKNVDEGAKKVPLVEINSDDAVEFVSEEKLNTKKKKNKRKHRIDNKDTTNSDKIPKTTKSTLNEKELVSEDLQWLQTI